MPNFELFCHRDDMFKMSNFFRFGVLHFVRHFGLGSLYMVKITINRMITRLGEVFHFDAHYFTKNTFWLLFGQAMASLAAFATTVIFANYVPKNIVGDYRLILSVYAVLTFFALSGLSAALIRSIVHEKDGTLRVALATKKRYSILAFLVGLGAVFYFWVLKENAVFGISILVMSVCLPVIEAYSIYSPYLQGKHNFKYSSVHGGIVKIVSGAVVIFVAYISPEVIYLISAFYITQAIVVYFQYKFLTKKFPPRNDIEDEEMVPYSKHTTLAGVFYMILGQADKFIVYHFFGPISLASYWIASTVPQEVSRVLVAVLQVAYPKFVKGDHETMKQLLTKKLMTLTWVLIAVACAYTLLAYPFFHLFFPQYSSDVSKSIVLMFGFAIVPHIFVWQYYTAKKNVAVVYINNIIDPVAQVILYILLIPFFGIWGLVYAILIKTIFMNLLAWYVLRKY